MTDLTCPRHLRPSAHWQNVSRPAHDLMCGQEDTEKESDDGRTQADLKRMWDAGAS